MSICAASNSPANYQFNYSTSPFTFAVARSDSNGEALFNTMGQRFVFKVCGVLTLSSASPLSGQATDWPIIQQAQVPHRVLLCCLIEHSSAILAEHSIAGFRATAAVSALRHPRICPRTPALLA